MSLIYQTCGDTSCVACYGNKSFHAPFMTRDYLQQSARQQLTTLLTRYPKAIPVLKTAIEQGRIVGKTWGSMDRLSGRFSGCILGWIAHAYASEPVSLTSVWGDPHMNAEVKGVCSSIGHAVMHLVDFPEPVHLGETHQTSPRLAFFYEIVCEVEQYVGRREQYAASREHVYQRIQSSDGRWTFVPTQLASSVVWKSVFPNTTAHTLDIFKDVAEVMDTLETQELCPA